MARTAALEAARAEAPATPVRESAAVGAVGAVMELRDWRVLDQFPDVHVIAKLYLAAQTPVAVVASAFPADQRETTVTKVKLVLMAAAITAIVVALAT